MAGAGEEVGADSVSGRLVGVGVNVAEAANSGPGAQVGGRLCAVVVWAGSVVGGGVRAQPKSSSNDKSRLAIRKSVDFRSTDVLIGRVPKLII